jgi:hypothetical protein
LHPHPVDLFFHGESSKIGKTTFVSLELFGVLFSLGTSISYESPRAKIIKLYN